MRFKIGDRVKYGHEKGTVTKLMNEHNNYYIEIHLDIGNWYSVPKESLKRLIKRKSIYKYVLKTQLMDDVYPKDHDRFVKVKVIK